MIFSLLLAASMGISSPVFAASLNSFANYFSISTQPLLTNQPVRFDDTNSNSSITLSADGHTVTLQKTGQYFITFTATGSLAGNSGGVPQQPGPWSVGLYRNNGLIVGSVAAAHSGTDAEDNLETLTTVGQVTINGSAGDTLQIRSTTTNDIVLEGTVSGGVVQNTSVSINIIQVQ